MANVSDTNNGETVEIHLGEPLEIRLGENATTGYRWEVDRNDGGALEALGATPSYVSDAIGSSGQVVFRFLPRNIGTGHIGLKYWRHWEGESSITVRFVLSVRVLP